MMNTMQSESNLTFNDRSVAVALTDAAQHALSQRDTPLFVQMELYFSCLLRLKVRFYEAIPESDVRWQKVNEKLLISFRPVMTAKCDNSYEGDEPPLTDFPIARETPFTPRWLHLDYRNGQWQGEFGYQELN
jgi:hypothetical protein